MASTPIHIDPDLADNVRRELERILASRWLRESQQLSRLLRYVVEETLAGRADGLKEYNLGLEVFHRSRDYDPRTDAIVRVQASQLRRKLLSFYESDGRDSQLRIEVPRGGYVPVFAPSSQSALVLAPDSTPDVPVYVAEAVAPPRLAWKAFGAGAAAMALLVAVASALIWWWPQTHEPGRESSVWSAFLDPDQTTIVSFGSPLFYTGANGIYVRDVLMNEQNEPHTEKMRKIEQTLGATLNPQNDVYTGIGEMLGVMDISQWMEQRNARVSRANSHYLGKSELQDKNLIVVSSMRFQTVLNDLRPPVAFPFIPDIGGTIENPSPMPGEARSYRAGGGGGLDKSYAILSMWPGTTKGRRILGLAGINTWSTQAAVRFALDGRQLLDLQRRLDADPPNGPRGKKSPFFQVILVAEGKYNQLLSVSYVTHRYLKTPEVLPW